MPLLKSFKSKRKKSIGCFQVFFFPILKPKLLMLEIGYCEMIHTYNSSLTQDPFIWSKTFWNYLCPSLTHQINLKGNFIIRNSKNLPLQWSIYSATTFLEKCRKAVLEKWFCKLRFFFWSTTFLEPEKKSEFAEPLFSNLKNVDS